MQRIEIWIAINLFTARFMNMRSRCVQKSTNARICNSIDQIRDEWDSTHDTITTRLSSLEKTQITWRYAYTHNNIRRSYSLFLCTEPQMQDDQAYEEWTQTMSTTHDRIAQRGFKQACCNRRNQRTHERKTTPKKYTFGIGIEMNPLDFRKSFRRVGSEVKTLYGSLFSFRFWWELVN